MDIPSESLKTQPKSLAKKLTHLMKDTKSSAARNAINNQGRLNTIDDAELQSSPTKLTPSKKKLSPSKSKKISGSKPAGKTSPLKETPYENFMLDSKFNLDDENGSGEYSLEGIAGMVKITPGKDVNDSNNQFYSLPVQQNSLFNEQEYELSSPAKVQNINVENKLISVDMLELDEICKNPNFVEIE